MIQVVEYLFSKCEALSSVPKITKKKKRKKNYWYKNKKTTLKMLSSHVQGRVWSLAPQ
jgi:hypothetical protein